MLRKMYVLEVRQVTYAKLEYHSTSNFHNNNRQLNIQFASFPMLLQSLNQTTLLLADNCCPHDEWAEWL